MKIIKSYKGLRLYEGGKSSKGFYKEMLASLYNLLAYSFQTMKNPTTIHFVIGEPTDLGNLSKYLERWRIKRIKFNQQLTSVKYFGTVEVRPYKKEEHLHLCIVADSIRYDDQSNLREMLTRFSLKKVCSLYKRKSSFLRPVVDLETGDMPSNKFGTDFQRKGKTWCHTLHLEFDDAFHRFSYLCKVQTKIEPNYICSRLLKLRETKQVEHPKPADQTSPATLLPLVQADFPRSECFQQTQRGEWMPQPAIYEDDVFEPEFFGHMDVGKLSLISNHSATCASF